MPPYTGYHERSSCVMGPQVFWDISCLHLSKSCLVPPNRKQKGASPAPLWLDRASDSCTKMEGQELHFRRWVGPSSAATHAWPTQALPSLTTAISKNCNLEAPDKMADKYLGATWKMHTGYNSHPAFLRDKGWKGIQNPGPRQQGTVPEPGDHPGRKLPQQPLLEMHLGSLAWNLLLGLAAECSSPQSRIRI